MWKKIITGIGTLVVFGSIASGVYFLESRYAKAEDANQNRLDIKINSVKDNIRWYQDQMSYIMNRCGVRDPNRLPTHAHKNYHDYRIKKESLDKELQILIQKKNKY
jgi:hypothetical protein